MDCANRKIRIRRCGLGISRFERCDATKFAKIGFRSVQNILETPAGLILLIPALRKRRNSKKTRTKKRKRKRKKPRTFSVHDVPAPEIRHTCAVSKDRAGSAPAAASAYFTDFSYALTILQLQLNRWDCRRAGCPSLTAGIGPPRVRTHLSSICRTHSATTQHGENCCAVLRSISFWIDRD